MIAGTELRSLNLAVLYGGRGGEREVSLASGRAVIETLREGGYSPLAVDTGAPAWWTELAGIQLAFNMQHGVGGEDGVTQGLLHAMGIVGTGSAVLGSALAMDKLRSKRLWQGVGLPTPDFAVLDDNCDLEALISEWGAAFVKPAREGSSLGMSRVDSVAGMESAREHAAQHDSVVIAERLIAGSEYTVAVLGDRTLPVIRVEAAGEFYDYQAKYKADDTGYHIPAGLSAEHQAEISELALAAFRALDCAVWGRVDLMLDPSRGFQLLEVNTIPGMTDHSLVPMAAEAAGMTPLQLLEEIMQLSWRARLSATQGIQP